MNDQETQAGIAIEQAIFVRQQTAAPVLHARSAGFADAWSVEAERLIVNFGIRPADLACPAALFARPFAERWVAVVQVADQPPAATTGPAETACSLAFRFLILERHDYETFLGDPFYLARLFPMPEAGVRALDTLHVPRRLLPPRTLAQVRRVLQRVKASALRDDENPEDPNFERTVENSESPALLGGVQALVDGGKLVFERPAPDPELVEGLWTLLPHSTRARLWPATFAFSNALGFDVVVVSRAFAADFEGYTSEEQAADYPAGHYEIALQVAAETGDERQLDGLLNRRSTHDTMRLGLVLLVAMILLVLSPRLLDWLVPSPAARVNQPHYKAAAAAGMIGVRDPWTALGLKLYGDILWGRRQE